VTKLDIGGLAAFCAAPGVSTACAAPARLLKQALPGWSFTDVPDGGFFARPPGAPPDALRLLLVTHIDEIGGIIAEPAGDGTWRTRIWGAPVERYTGPLQRFPIGEEGSAAACEGLIDSSGPTAELVVRGRDLRPWRDAFTFAQEARVEGETLYAKAIDPRATAWASLSAAQSVGSDAVGLAFCVGEECGMLAPQKLAHAAGRAFPALEYVVNADVPGAGNLEGAQVGEVALRWAEGSRQIDPAFTVGTWERLREQGVEIALAGARSGSQTACFLPYAQCLSVALPAHEIHTRCASIPIAAVERCVRALEAICSLLLGGA
jgi:putative aminopeptidase FrvX